MDFYESIVEYYDHISPLNTVQLDFVKHRLANTEKLSVLEAISQ